MHHLALKWQGRFPRNLHSVSTKPIENRITMKKLALATMLVAFACGIIHAQDPAAPPPEAKAPCVKKCCPKKKACPTKAECPKRKCCAEMKVCPKPCPKAACPEKKCCPAKAACPGKK
jgi:hypothetical protein